MVRNGECGEKWREWREMEREERESTRARATGATVLTNAAPDLLAEQLHFQQWWYHSHRSLGLGFGWVVVLVGVLFWFFIC